MFFNLNGETLKNFCVHSNLEIEGGEIIYLTFFMFNFGFLLEKC